MQPAASIALPEPPDPASVPDAQRGAGTLPLRYEDVTQDGRLALATLSPVLGEAVWKPLLARTPTSAALREQGIVPILTRMVLEGGEGPIGIAAPLDARGLYQLAHARDQAGEVQRIVVNMWAEARAPRGRALGPPPERAGEVVRVGRVFAEHVLTRLFAPPESRRVVRIEAPGMPEVPEARVALFRAARVMELPAGATPLEDARADEATIAFGLAHTDSNQHVNSLVYPRLFEDAALRRLAALGRETSALSARLCEVAYRKPSFAGERARVVLRAFELDGRVGALGAFVGEGDQDTSRARAYVRILFDA